MRSPILVRPRPEIGESLPGFLLRLANRNGISLRHLFDDLGFNDRTPARATDFFTEKRSLEQVEDALLLPRGGLMDLMYPVLARSKNTHHPLGIDYLGRNIPHGLIHRDFSPFCPRCLEAEPYFQQEWEFLLNVNCEKHHCELVDTCPNCGLRQSWKRDQLLACQCGRELRTFQTNDVELNQLPNTPLEIRQLAFLCALSAFPLRDRPRWRTLHIISIAPLRIIIFRAQQAMRSSDEIIRFMRIALIRRQQAMASANSDRLLQPLFAIVPGEIELIRWCRSIRKGNFPTLKWTATTCY